MSVSYPNTTINLTYGSGGISDLPTITLSGGLFTLSITNNNISIDQTSGLITFSPTLDVNTYTFNAIYTVDSTPSSVEFTVNVSQKLIYALSNDKIYDSTTVPQITISGLVTGDFLGYIANFSDPNVGNNKLINFTLSDTLVNTFNLFPLNLDSSLALYYPYDSDFLNYLSVVGVNSGSAINNPVISNSTYHVGSGSLSLVGSSSQYFNVGNFTLTTAGFATSMWINTSDTGTHSRLFQYMSASPFGMIFLSNEYNSLYLTVVKNGSNAVFTQVATNSQYATNSWIHLVFNITYVTDSSSTYKLYINGSEVTSLSGEYPPIATYNTNTLGYDGAGTYTTMNVDDFRVYNRSLNSTEISSLYNYSGFGMISTKNYNYNVALPIYGNILQKEISLTANDKIYDGTILVQLTTSGLIYGDSLGYIANFSDPNVGNNKLINLTLSDTFASSFNLFPLNLDSSLALYYPYDSDFLNYLSVVGVNSGSAINNPVISNSTYHVGSGSLSLVGSSSQYFNIGNFTLTTAGFATSMWINTSDTGTHTRLFQYMSASPFGMIFLSNEYNSLYLTVVKNGSNAVFAQVATNSQYATNSWIHLVFNITYVTDSSSTYKLYINGSEVTSLTGEYPPIATYNTNTLGYDGAGTYTTMNVDDFRVYNRSLNSTEVSSLYNYSGFGLVQTTNNNNYHLNSSTLYANILTRNISLIPIGNDKIYDHTTNASFTYTLSGLINNDAVDIYGYTAVYNDANVSNNKLININNVTLSGLSSSNYTINTSATTQSNIIQRNLNPIVNDKIYDHNTLASITLSNIISSEVNDFIYSANFDDYNVGNNKSVSFTPQQYYTSLYALYRFDQNTIQNNTIINSITNLYDLSISGNFTINTSNNIVGNGSGEFGNNTYLLSNYVFAPMVFSVAFWIYPVSNSNYQAIASCRRLLTTPIGGWVIYINESTGYLEFWFGLGYVPGDPLVGGGGGEYAAWYNARIVPVSSIFNHWSFFTFTYENDILHSYLNGTLIDTQTISVTSGSRVFKYSNVGVTDHLTIGCADYTTPSYPLSNNTLIDNFMLFTSQLSGPQVSNIYNNTLNDSIYSNYSYPNTIYGNILPKDLSLLALGNSKYYDGTTNATITYSLSGIIFNDNVDISNVYLANFNDPTVGNNKPIDITNLSLTGPSSLNYSIQSNSSTTGDILNLIELTLVPTGISKPYDGTTTATFTYTLTGTLSGDIVDITGYTANFDTKDVGTNKTITIENVNLTGLDSNKYYINSTSTTTGDITAIELTLTPTGINKPYDGTTYATFTYSLTGSISGDVIDITGYSANFTDKTIGTGKTVNITNIGLTGTNSSNYTVNSSSSTTANITAIELTLTPTGVNKPYDTTTTATFTYSLVGTISGDVVDITGYTADFVDGSVGTNKTIDISNITLTGTDSGNYTINSTSSTTANITAIELTLVPTGDNKPYDRTTTATFTYTISGILGSDAVDIFNYTADFTSNSVGTGKTINISNIALNGAESNNYTISSTSSTTANITAIELSLVPTGNNKPYDGTIYGSFSYTISGVIESDLVDITGYSATFNNKNVEGSKTLYISNISLTGNDSSNYTINSTSSTSADITAIELTLMPTGVNKPYDTTTAATFTYSLVGTISGDLVDITGYTADFITAAVGNNITIDIGSITLIGTDSGNYAINSTSSTTANITAIELTLVPTGNNKPYDNSTTATFTYTISGILGSDAVDITNYTAEFTTETVGTGKTINITNIGLTGAQSNNYTISSTSSTTADITAIELTLVPTGDNKPYDDTTYATFTYSISGIIGLDVVDITGYTASFTDATIGTGKTINITNISLTGNDSGNYTINSTSSTTADITAITLTLMATGDNKPYDGTTAATFTYSLVGTLSGDIVDITGYLSSFVTPSVGTNKTINITNISLTGTDSGNYTINSSDTTTADITAIELTLVPSGINKPYDGTTYATFNYSLTGTISGDVVDITGYTANFTDKTIGTAKTVNITNIALTGSEGGNYTINSTSSTTADITAIELTLVPTGVNKEYDTTTTASFTYSLTGTISGDVVDITGYTASFVDATIGNGKTINITNISLTGTDSGNYTINSTSSTTANITRITLTLMATGDNKPYDTNTNATFTYSLVGTLSGDIVDLSNNYIASFIDPTVGNGKTILITNITLTGSSSSNYTISSTDATTANITALTLTINVTGQDKYYDTTRVAGISYTLSGIIGSDNVDISNNYVSEFDTASVGSGKSVSISNLTLTGSESINYLINSTATTTASILQLPISFIPHGINKAYDSTVLAYINYTLSAKIGSDDVDISNNYSSTYLDANVGTNKLVNISNLSLFGSSSNNYDLRSSTSSTTSDITAKEIIVNALGTNKNYDATTNAAITYTLSGFLNSDYSSISNYTASFATATAGLNKTINVSGIQFTNPQTNYYVNGSATTSANIDQLNLTLNVQGKDKIYDASNNALFNFTLSGMVNNEDVGLMANALFLDSNAGLNKGILLTDIQLAGPNAVNYSTVISASTHANIYQRIINPSFNATKVFDRLTSATLTYTLSGAINNDDVTLANYVANYNNYNVGQSKPVVITDLQLGGSSASNYIITSSGSILGSITSKPLSVNYNVTTKTYNASQNATITYTLSGIVSGDTIDLSNNLSYFFVDANAGNNKPVVVQNITLYGSDPTNYFVSISGVTYGTINPLLLNVSISGVNKLYDTTTNALVTLSLSGIINNDSVSINSYVANFTNNLVGVNKTVNVSSIALSNSNYTTQPISTVANIYASQIQTYFTAQDKIYDATTNVQLISYSLSGIYSSDNGLVDICNNYIGQFRSYWAGTNSPIDVLNINLTGPASSNYSVASSSVTNANIYKRLITATGIDKIYNRQYPDTVSLSGVINNDIISYVANFIDYNVGNNKLVVVSLSDQLPLIYNYDLSNISPYTTISFTNMQSPMIGMAMDVTETRAVFCQIGGLIYFSTYSNGSWSALTQTLEVNSRNYYKICLSADGSRGIVTDPNYIYFFTWNGTNYSALTRILDNNYRNYYSLALTADGSRLVAAANGNFVYFSTWNGTNYSALTQTLDNTARNYIGMAIAPDGSRIACQDSQNRTYWANWNGSNYTTGTAMTSPFPGITRSLVMSPDKNVLYLAGAALTPNMYYTVWTGSNYGSWIPLNSSIIPYGIDAWGLFINSTGSTIYLKAYGDINVYKVTVPTTIQPGSKDLNYVLSSNITYANIYQKLLTVNWIGTKVYNTDTNMTITYNLNGVVSGDGSSVDLSQNYVLTSITDPNVGTKNLAASNQSLYLSASPNYYVATDVSFNVTITKQPLIINFTAMDKIFDHTHNVNLVSYTISGIYPSDLGTIDISNNYRSFFEDYRVNYNRIDISGLRPYGTAQSIANYSIPNVQYAYANVYPLPITVTGVDKIYDHTTLDFVTISNVLGNDTIAYFANFTDYKVGSNIPVNVTLSSYLNVTSGLQLWLDATDSSTLVLSGSNLTTWKDKSGYGRDTTYSNGSNIQYTATGFNGKAGLQFNQQILYSSVPAGTFTNGFTVFVVFQKTGSNVNDCLVSRQYNGNAACFDLYGNTIGFGNGSIQTLAIGQVVDVQTLTSPTVYYLSCNTATFTVNTNGTNRNNGTVNPGYYGDTAPYFYVGGRRDNGTHFIGLMSEVIVFNRYLNTTETKQVESYLAMKYGLYSSFSNSHLVSSYINSRNYILSNTLTNANILYRRAAIYNATKTYDTTTNGTGLITFTLSNIITGDTVNVLSYTATYNSNNVSNANTVSLDNIVLYGFDSSNYIIDSSMNTMGTILPSSLFATVYGLDKIYDRTTNALLTYTLSGIYNVDIGTIDLSFNYVARFRTYNVGNNITIDISNISLTGTQTSMANYSITNYKTATASILPKQMYLLASDKTYDQKSVALATLSGVINGDTIQYQAYFSDPSAAVNKDVYVTLSNYISESNLVSYFTFDTNSISGNFLGDLATGSYNYNNGSMLVNNPTINTSDYRTGNASIQFSAASSQYATIAPFTTLSGGLTFAFWVKSPATNANNTPICEFCNGAAVDHIIITPNCGSTNNLGIFVINVGGGNTITYTSCPLNNNTWTHITITMTYAPYGVATSIYKVYLNGNYHSTYNSNFYPGAVTRTINTFAKSTIGNANFSGSIDSFKIYNSIQSDSSIANNYLFTSVFFNTNYNYYLATNYSTATIFPKLLSFNSTTKTYDSTTTAILSLSGIIAGDSVTPTYVADYTNANVGTNKTINYSTASLSNSNYTIPASGLASGTINRSTVIGVFTSNKYYDRFSPAPLTWTISGVYASDIGFIDISSSVYGNFVNSNSGTNIRVDISNVSIYGSAASNYVIDTRSVTFGNIYPKLVNAYGRDKTYDRNTNALVTLSGSISPDTVVYYASFVDMNVNNNILVNVSISSLNNNYQLTSNTTNANILAKPLRILPSGVNKIYDSTNVAGITYTLSGIISGDSVDVSGIYVATFNNANVGNTKLISINNINLYGSNYANYSIDSTSTTSANVIKARITPTFTTAKTYDRTTAAPLNYTLSGIYPSDLGTIDITGFTGVYYSVNVGNNILVDISNITLSGTAQSLGNYLTATEAFTHGDIYPKLLNVYGIDKTYDRKTTALVSVSGIISPDLTPYIANFSDINVGTDKLVTVSLSNVVTNYQLNNTTTLATIFAKPLRILPSGVNKIYDSTNVAGITYTLSGIISGDSVDVSGIYVATFNNANVGNTKLISINNINLYGSNYANYSIDSTSTTSANVIKARITPTFTTAKTYDRTTAAPLNYTLSGIYPSDLGTIDITGFTGVYYSVNVGNNILVDISNITLSGTAQSLGNYLTATEAFTHGNIYPKLLNVYGIDKTYDQKTIALVSVSGIISPDLTPYIANFSDINVGTDKLVTVSLSNVVTNYQLNNTTTTANIFVKPLTLLPHGVDKIYDTTTLAYITESISGIINGDTVTFDSYAAHYLSSNAGVNKTILYDSIVLGGSSSTNYTIATSGTTNGTIYPQTINPTFTCTDKYYDRTTSTTGLLSYTLSGIYSSDLGTVDITGFTGVFYTRNAGNNILVDISNISLSGTVDSLNNYVTATERFTHANIIPKLLNVYGIDKTYDRKTTALVSVSGVISPDTSPYIANFSDINVGTDKLVTVSLSNVVTNYQLNNTTTLATIFAKPLELLPHGVNKVYDSTTAANITYSISGIISGDSVDISNIYVADFDTANVGTNKTVNINTINLIGSSSTNYSMADTAATTANISKATITANFTANKYYDRTTAAPLTYTLSGIYSSDLGTVDITGFTGVFVSSNAANNILVDVSNIALTGSSVGNYTTSTEAFTRGNIYPKLLNVYGIDKTYDRKTTALVSVSGVISPDASPYIANFSDINVGTDKLVTVSLSNVVTNYQLNNTTTLATIFAKPLGLLPHGVNKVYDSTTAANITYSISGIISGDSVDISNIYVANFDTANAGTNKTVNINTINLIGSSSTNYSMADTAATTANISKATITPTFGSIKTYDRTTNAPLTYTLAGIYSSDLGTVDIKNFSGVFVSSNAGTNILVDISNITLSGTVDSLNNYTTPTEAFTTGTILKKGINVYGQDKIYDKNSNALLNINGLISPDTVSYTATFSDALVENFKTINVSLSSSVINYSLNNYTTNASILPKPLGLLPSGVNKVYDSTTAANITYSISGIISGDSVDISNIYVANFDTANVGTNKTVNINTINLIGSSSTNYSIVDTAATTANISKATITANFTANKYYDRTTAAPLTYTLSGIYSSDLGTVDITGFTGVFVSSNAANNILVDVSNIALTGSSVGNYTTSTEAFTRGNIYPKLLNVYGIDKTYDRKTTALVSVSGVISPDLTPYIANFSDINVGTDKLVTVSLSNVVTNYQLNNTTTLATIFAKPLELLPSGVNKVYDTTTAANITYSISGIINGDSVDISNIYVANFDTANVGTNKTVNINTINLIGSSSTNYSMADTAATTANISKATITANFTANKYYDRTTAAPLTYTLSGIYSSDLGTVDITGFTGVFVSSNAANNILVDVSNIALTGSSVGNYTTSTEAFTRGNIYPKLLNVYGIDKTYDRKTTALVSVSGVISPDASPYIANFSDINVGTNKLVTVSLSNVVTNYQLNNTTTTANIFAKPLGLLPSGVNKIYDTTTAANITYSISGIISGDSVSIANNYVADFDTANAGTNKSVSISSINLAGTDNGNYSIDSTSSTTANILKRQINASFVANKYYDGTTIAPYTYTLSGVYSSDLGTIDLNQNAVALFRSKNVGTNILIDISNVGLTGTTDSLNNYSILSYSLISGDIYKKQLNIYGNDKTYDKNTIATITLSGVVSNDTINYVANFIDYYVGNNKTINLTLSGTTLSNYDYPLSTTANILKKMITMTAVGVNRRYNGSLAGQISSYSLSGIISGDVVDISNNYVSTFAEYRGVSVPLYVTNITLIGSSIANYDISNTTVTYADITGGQVIINWIPIGKIYDRNSYAPLNYTLDGIYPDDIPDVNINNDFIANYRNVNAGNNIMIDISNIVLTGSLASNYMVTSVQTTSGPIYQRPIYTTTGDKIYDGTRNALLTLSNILSGDTVNFNYNATFDTKNVGTNKLVTISSLINGPQGPNYVLNSTTNTASIFAKDISLIPTGIDKIYDGTRLAAFNYTLSGTITGDNVDISNTPASFVSQIAGNNKFMNIVNIALVGQDSINYLIGSTSGTTANILKKTLTLYSTADNKIYDSTTAANIRSYSLSGIVLNDTIDINNNYVPSFVNPNAGIQKTVAIDNLSLNGPQNANYTIPTPSYTTADILPRTINPTFSSTKTYDRTNVATTLTYTLSGVYASDIGTVSLKNYYGTYADVNVANSIYVDISNVTLSGTAQSLNNYVVFSESKTYGSITPKFINVTGQNKIYDKKYDAGITTNDVISPDTITYIANFVNLNAGTNILINVSLSSNVINYQLQNTTTTANILQRTITPSSWTVSKVYDRNNLANLATHTLSNIILGDIVDISNVYTATYAQTTVGNNISVSYSNLSLFGPQKPNYTISSTGSTLGSITQRSVYPVGVNKMYDNTTLARVTLSNVVGIDVVVPPSGNFNNKNVGNNKTVTIPNSLSGADSSNYTLGSLTTTANVIPFNLTGTGNNKIYDSTRIAGITLSGIFSGDTVSVTGLFDTKNTGNNKLISLTNNLTGSSAANYTLVTTQTTANVYKSPAYLNFLPTSKLYDGNTNARVYYNSISGLYAGDELYMTSYTANYNDATVSDNKQVYVTDIVLQGRDISNYVYHSSQIVNNARIFLLPPNIFMNSTLIINQNTNVYTNINNESNLVYDYLLSVNVAGLPGVNSDITNIFKSASFKQDANNIENVDFNINILPSTLLNGFIFDWNDVNQQNIVNIVAGQSTTGFGTFPQIQEKFGDRILEIVAHKIFGHAQSHAAISNDYDFYTHDAELWDHISETVNTPSIQCDIFNEYIAVGRMNKYNNAIVNGDINNDNDVNNWVNFNFKGLSFDFLTYLNGAIVLNNTLTQDEKNMLNNGPAVGGTQLVNGSYNVPILIRFHD